MLLIMRRITFVLLLISSLASARAQGSKALLTIKQSRAGTPGEVVLDCLEVDGSGSYRFEHAIMEAQGKAPRKLHAGQLTKDEMEQLRTILDAPALVSLPSTKFQGTAAVGSDGFVISIFREGERQALLFDDTGGNNRFSTIKLPTSSGTKEIKPLLKWYRQLANRKNDIDSSAAPVCNVPRVELPPGYLPAH
jgi:hypothetical protein